MGLIIASLKRDRLFVSSISTQHKSRSTIVDVKVYIHSNVSTTVVVREIFTCTKVVLSFKIPDHKSSKVSTFVTVSIKLLIPPHMKIFYRAITSCIGLTPTPFLEGSVSIGTKESSLGGEVGLDTSTASFTKYNAGIGMVKPDFSTSLILGDKGEMLKASYIHIVNHLKGATVGAKISHKLSIFDGSFAIGSFYALDPLTVGGNDEVSRSGFASVPNSRPSKVTTTTQQKAIAKKKGPLDSLKSKVLGNLIDSEEETQWAIESYGAGTKSTEEDFANCLVGVDSLSTFFIEGHQMMNQSLAIELLSSKNIEKELIADKEDLKAKLDKIKLRAVTSREAIVKDAKKIWEGERRKEIEKIRIDLAKEMEDFEDDVREQILAM
ncbi:hypothetical protein GIB67_029520 [Kingdonia uniflora]|uniref:Uncharacterized protein n=1 Tax=Kingdonia uniflora TaxID=39325 RepID=A0A7J7NYN6_9MAGN|nr:hypothetical protein GIB67_029520 [Kingdonia uniflora]